MGTCILADGDLAKPGWIVMESATQANFKEQLVGHSQVQMDKIHGPRHGHWTQHHGPGNANYPTAVQKINIDSGEAQKQGP